MNRGQYATEQQVTKKNGRYDLKEMQDRKQQSTLGNQMYTMLFPEVNGVKGYHIYKDQPLYKEVNRRPDVDSQQPYVFSSFANLHAPTMWVETWQGRNQRDANESMDDWWGRMSDDYISEFYVLVGFAATESFVTDLSFNSVVSNPIIYTGGVVNTFNTSDKEIRLGDVLMARPPRAGLNGNGQRPTGLSLQTRIEGIPHNMPCGVVTAVRHQRDNLHKSTYDLIVAASIFANANPRNPLFDGCDPDQAIARKAVQMIEKRDKWVFGRSWSQAAPASLVEIQLMQITL
jgi:hypothetical protein